MTLRTSTLLLLAAVSCASPPPLVTATPGNLQPLDFGLEWTYEADGVIQVRRVAGVENVGRFECRVVEARTGKVVERTWMRWEGEGLMVYRVSPGGHVVDFDDPLPIILRKAAPGATWTFEERHGPITLSVEAKYEGDDELSVLKQIRKCARIRLAKRVAGRVVVDQTCWYAMDVGLVRMFVIAAGEKGDVRTTLVLKSCNFLPE